jgi:hypothetical protein
MRWLIALVLSIFVGWIVWLWPVLPLWTGEMKDPAKVQGFTPEGDRFITTHLPEDEGRLPYVCYWDVSRGVVLGRVSFADFPGRQGLGIKRIELMDDQRTFIVSDQPRLTEFERAIRSRAYLEEGKKDLVNTWYLVDGQTGACVQGPNRGEEEVLRTTCREGRWFCIQKRDGLSLHTRDGRLVREWTETDGWVPHHLRVAPDGRSAALLWHDAAAAWRLALSVVELPACHERFMVELSQVSGTVVQSWDGRRVEIGDRVGQPWTIDTQQFRVHVFSPNEAVVLPEPEDQFLRGLYGDGKALTYRQGGPGWAAFVGPWWRPESAWESLLSYLKLSPPSSGQRQLRSEDVMIMVRERPSGRFRPTLPTKLREPVLISPGGDYLVSTTDTGVAVWDLHPVPRWQKVIITTNLVFGLLLWRQRRRATRQMA